MARVRTHHRRAPAGHIAAGAFKARCLEIMDTVNRERTSVIITKHGRPVACLSPVASLVPSPIGALAGSVVSSDLVAVDPKSWPSVADPLDRG